jgi:hypothetical protein
MRSKVLRLTFLACLFLLTAWLIAPVPVRNETCKRSCPGGKGAGAELLWESLSQQIGSGIGM